MTKRWITFPTDCGNCSHKMDCAIFVEIDMDSISGETEMPCPYCQKRMKVELVVYTVSSEQPL